MSGAEEVGRKAALSNHQRRGKFYLPPMAQVPIHAVDSLKREAPDFIWPIVLWSEGGDSHLRELCRLQEEVSDRLTQTKTLASSSTPRLDGKLSTLELWDTEGREAHRAFLIERVETRGLVSDSTKALGMLAEGLAEWAKVGHLNALAKYLTYT